MRAVAKIFLIIVMFAAISLHAETVQIPEWHKLNAKLNGYPEVGKSVELIVNLESLIGNIPETDIKLLLPANWKSDRINAKMPAVKAGSFAELKFEITPADFLSQGSIIVQADVTVPKSAIVEKINSEFKTNSSEMAKTVSNWPDVAKRYADVAFAIYPEESFYPLTGNMWLDYDDTLSPREGFRGPAYYEDKMLSAHQAQTDVEMFEKLAVFMASEKGFAKTLVESGIDLKKKEYDYFSGLYVLAVKDFKESKYEQATAFANLLLQKLPDKGVLYENIKISAYNLRGLIFWAQGQKRVAEDALKKAFYVNRKHPLQRYILRNIGLLMVSRRDDITAQQMYKLAISYKSGYTLAKREALILGNN
ncbi:MAG: hypothetical protein PHF29_10270 [Candidatus Riflebacteria bacterium]|nr:hypothetical protein [Candidatus Riflebacteria bacterium]